MNKYNIASEYLKNCSYCHGAGASFQCTNCCRAKYCDRQCQKDHWHEHKSACREFAQERLRNNQTPQATTLNEEAKRAEEFIESVYQDDIEAVKTYIDNNGNVNYRSVRNDDQKKMIFRGDTGLMVSSTHNKVKIASFLLSHGADVNAKAKKDNCTALHTSNTPEMTLLLLENGAEVNATEVMKFYNADTPTDKHVPLFSSFSYESLLAIKRYCPGIPRAYLISNLNKCNGWLDQMKELEAVAVHTNYKNLTKGFIIYFFKFTCIQYLLIIIYPQS